MNFTLGFNISNAPEYQEVSQSKITEIAEKLKEGDMVWLKHDLEIQVPKSLNGKIKRVFPTNFDRKVLGASDLENSAFIECLSFQASFAPSPLIAALENSIMAMLIFSENGPLVYANHTAINSLNFESIPPLGLVLLEDFGFINSEKQIENLYEPADTDFGFGKLLFGENTPLEATHLQRRWIIDRDQKFLVLEFKSLPEFQEMEFKLNLSESKSRHLLAHNLGAYIISDRKGLIKQCSGNVQEILGYKSEVLIGTNSLDYCHPDDLAMKLGAIEGIQGSKGLSADLKYRLKQADGKYRWITAIITNYLDTPGINGFVTVVQDIDQQQKVQEELVRSNQRFKWASKATQDVIWDWDYRNSQISWGENLLSAFGWKSDDLATIDLWYEKVHSDDHQAVEASLEKAIESKSKYWEAHYRFLKKDGTYAHIKDRGYIERSPEGEVLRLVGAMHDFSIQMQREVELKTEKDKFSQLFAGSLIGVARLDLRSRQWQECNQALLNMLGYHDEEFKGMRIKQLIPAKHQKQNEEVLEQLKANKAIKPYQTELLRKDLGSTKVVVSAFAADEEAAWFHFLDLGPIEESNRALVEAESRFRQYVEKASDIFATLNWNGQFDYISPNAEQILGYHPSEIIGKANLPLIHPEDAKKAIKTYQEAWRNPGRSVRLVFRLRHKEGRWIWLEVNGSIQSRDGQLKAFLNIRDVEKEHQQEAELRKLSLVANRTSNGVLIVDANKNVEWINESYQRMSGYKLSEVKGKLMDSLVHGPKSKRFDEGILKEDISSGKPLRFDNINYRKDGSEYWVESIITPVIDENGQLTNYISIETDVTERKLEEINFRENLNLISEQNERLRSFAHIISHNFRSHGSNIQQLSRELNITSDPILRDELYQYLESSSKGLMKALDELSSLLEVESAAELPTEELSVMEYCLRVRQILSRPTMEINAELHFDVPPDFSIRFYPAYLESVLFNLISNALRYHDPEKDPWVKVWVEEKEQVKNLYISDNGIGFDTEKDGDAIFKYKHSAHNHPDSTGIGLYLVRSQIESLGGEIRVNSIIGKGTTFKVSVPKA